ncbi:hypothetical protein D3C80_2173590 [compost metagenome]
MPDLLIRPTVGFIPTIAFCTAGLKIEPDVSVPTAIVVKSAETEAADPVLEPPGK